MDQETVVVEKIECYTHRSQEEGKAMHRSAWGSTNAGQGEGRRGMQTRAFVEFLWEGTGKAEYTILGLARLENFSGFWGLGLSLGAWHEQLDSGLDVRVQ